MAIRDRLENIMGEMLTIDDYVFEDSSISITRVLSKKYYDYLTNEAKEGAKYSKITCVETDCFEVKDYLLRDDTEVFNSSRIYAISHVREINTFDVPEAKPYKPPY